MFGVNCDHQTNDVHRSTHSTLNGRYFSHKTLLFTIVYHGPDLTEILKLPLSFVELLGKMAINVIDWTVACVVSLLCLHCSQGWQWQMVALDTSVVNISKYKLFVFTSDRKQICPAKLKNWTTFCTGNRAGKLSPLSSPLFNKLSFQIQPRHFLFKAPL